MHSASSSAQSSSRSMTAGLPGTQNCSVGIHRRRFLLSHILGASVNPVEIFAHVQRGGISFFGRGPALRKEGHYISLRYLFICATDENMRRSGSPCAGINRHAAGNERVLQERISEPPGLQALRTINPAQFPPRAEFRERGLARSSRTNSQSRPQQSHQSSPAIEISTVTA